MPGKIGRPKKEDHIYNLVMRLFHSSCVLCHATYGVTVHEIVPRSLAPTTWMEQENRVPLCSVCHEKIHNMSKRDREALLIPARDRALKYL